MQLIIQFFNWWNGINGDGFWAIALQKELEDIEITCLFSKDDIGYILGKLNHFLGMMISKCIKVH